MATRPIAKPATGVDRWFGIKSKIHAKLLNSLTHDQLKALNKEGVRAQVGNVVENIVTDESVPMTTIERDRLVEEVLDEVFGLGPLEPLLKDPTVSDRVTMLHIGERMILAHPLAGVGPNMVQRLYVEYRGEDTLVGPDGVVHINPHLHNNPLQIAAERGLPALVLWLWFIVALVTDGWAKFVRGEHRALAATALATVVALLTAGLFEYNFGDSEVLMLFLIIVTLPAAAEAAVLSRAA